MDSKALQGYLVLADISGYTGFLAKSELEHAHDILTDLLEVIVGQFRPLLTISKLEGDAVFAYAPDGALLRSDALLDLIESTYSAFRDRLVAARRRTTCTCNACRNIPSLDLKFMSHYGDFMIQNVAGTRELVGTDVNAVHRLMKNHVGEATGWRGYALFSAACLEKSGLTLSGLHEQIENYEHLGDIKTFSLNLGPRYEAMVEQRQEIVEADKATITYTFDVPVPKSLAWEVLNDPEKLSAARGLHVDKLKAADGRTGLGSRNHCHHGKSVTVETITDWRPYQYFTTESVTPPDMRWMIPDLTISHVLQSTDIGTRFEVRIKARQDGPPWLTWLKVNMMKTVGRPDRSYEKLAQYMKEEFARRRGMDEPVIEAGGGETNRPDGVPIGAA